MTLSSMTGFSRAQGRTERCSWAWEAKSVNGRGLDVRCRLPNGLDHLDQLVREKVSAQFRRGNVSLGLSVTWTQREAGYRINEAVLEEVVKLLPVVRERIPDAAPPSLDGIFALRGVIESVDEGVAEDEQKALDAAILESLDVALEALKAARLAEGARLTEVLDGQLGEIADLCEEAEKLAAMQPQAIRERLRQQIAALLEDVPGLPEERLAQEAALLMTKADCREELDRLEAHLEAARALMADPKAVGRRLDFLCQEFNREANTLCSKASDTDLSRVGIALKAVIDQFREQVQNIE